ncbi:hypothetical protein H8356DRAFT_1332385 [Neocallimastix lanati (nom. inval.)]|nr:hypothetical protein H8356DRAFT_1332385 [Neocallimastix sp. JGI-2020a]
MSCTDHSKNAHFFDAICGSLYRNYAFGLVLLLLIPTLRQAIASIFGGEWPKRLHHKNQEDFGKTSIDAMLVVYYSKEIESKKIFNQLKVSKDFSSTKLDNKFEIDQYNKLKMGIEQLYPNLKMLNRYNQPYVAFVYMTGVLPIVKQTSTSSLNYKKYYQYFGFSEKEVKELYLERWYNDYRSYNETGRKDELETIINFDISDIKEEDFIELIAGNELSIQLENFGLEEIQKEKQKKKRIKN